MSGDLEGHARKPSPSIQLYGKCYFGNCIDIVPKTWRYSIQLEIVLIRAGTRALSRFLPEREKSNYANFHLATPYSHDFRMIINDFELLIEFIGLSETALATFYRVYMP
jgi:hypothetical protein